MWKYCSCERVHCAQMIERSWGEGCELNDKCECCESSHKNDRIDSSSDLSAHPAPGDRQAGMGQYHYVKCSQYHYINSQCISRQHCAASHDSHHDAHHTSSHPPAIQTATHLHHQTPHILPVAFLCTGCDTMVSGCVLPV